jgi:hypothetical protein
MRAIFRGVLVLLCVLGFFAGSDQVLAQGKNVDAEGEAAIVNNDVPSAKQEAVARAKWSAIEQAVGVQVKAQSFVQNFTLVDDAMKTEVTGAIRDYKITSEEKRQDLYWVRIRARVEPTKAQQAVSALALNNSIAVFIPAKKPKAGGSDEYDETNILSETLIGKLKAQDYTVVDIAPTNAIDAAEIERAAKGGQTMTLRSLMYKFLSNLLIIGKIDYTISTKKGEDIGYGISMPFNNVTVKLTYRMVAKNNKTGQTEVLTAGYEQGKGLANNVEDAASEALKDLAEKITPKLLDKSAQFMQGNVKKIGVKVAGVKDLETNMDVKQVLQNIVWVTGVDEKEMGEFVVSYPENTLYLANSIKQKGNFKIVNFSNYSITLEYQKEK